LDQISAIDTDFGGGIGHSCANPIFSFKLFDEWTQFHNYRDEPINPPFFSSPEIE